MPSDHNWGGDISEKTEKTILVGLVVPVGVPPFPANGVADRIPAQNDHLRDDPGAEWSYSIQNDS